MEDWLLTGRTAPRAAHAWGRREGRRVAGSQGRKSQVAVSRIRKSLPYNQPSPPARGCLAQCTSGRWSWRTISWRHGDMYGVSVGSWTVEPGVPWSEPTAHRHRPALLVGRLGGDGVGVGRPGGGTEHCRKQARCYRQRHGRVKKRALEVPTGMLVGIARQRSRREHRSRRWMEAAGVAGFKRAEIRANDSCNLSTAGVSATLPLCVLRTAGRKRTDSQDGQDTARARCRRGTPAA